MFVLSNGDLYQANELGNCEKIEINDTCEPIQFIKCYIEKNVVVAVTQSTTLIEFSAINGVMVPTRNAKLNIELNDHKKDILLAPSGHLICMTATGKIQCFNLVNDDNYELEIPDNTDTNRAISFAFAPVANVLLVCLEDGRCIFWKYHDSFQNWLVVEVSTYVNETSSFSCLLTKNFFLIKDASRVTILVENYSKAASRNGMVAFQINPTCVALFNQENHEPFSVLDTGMKISGITMGLRYVCIWGDDEVRTYKIDGCKKRCELYAEIALKVNSVAINDNSLFMAKNRSLLVTDMSGVQQLTIIMPEEEGIISYLDTSCDELLTIITKFGTVKTMDIAQREPKLLTLKNDIFHSVNTKADLTVLSLTCNSDGTIASILCQSTKINMRLIYFLNVKTGKIEQLETALEEETMIMSYCWDQTFPNLFTYELRHRNKITSRVLTLFVSEELNVYAHEDIQFNTFSRLVSMNIPSQLFLSRGEKFTPTLERPASTNVLEEREIEGFHDIDVSNTNLLSAVVDFTFFLTAGNLDKACLCIESTKNQSAWKKLIQASILQNRLDIAKRCLMKLGNGLGVAAVDRTTDKDVALAEVAIQVGMIDDAERLYREHCKVDLLCDLYRRRNKWNEAFETCNHEGSVKEKTLRLHYERYLEQQIGSADVSSLHDNKKSLQSQKAILKNLILNNEPVESFLQEEDSTELLHWYAKYLENTGNFSSAKELYTIFNDHLSLIRIACLEGELNDAFSLVRHTKSSAGAYHLARHLEASGDIEGAISCFARCGKYNYAIRLAKKFQMDAAITSLAAHCEPSKQVECATFLEKIGHKERAAELYIKAGNSKKALDLIAQLPLKETNMQLQADALNIIDVLDKDASKDTCHKCAILLLKAGYNKKAIHFLSQRGSTVDDILKFCQVEEVKLTEDLIDEILSRSEKNLHKEYLRTIALICQHQGDQILACKKFTQGGDRYSAIKCLLLTGDTKTIISYALTSRTKEVYIIAANYVQTL